MEGQHLCQYITRASKDENIDCPTEFPTVVKKKNGEGFHFLARRSDVINPIFVHTVDLLEFKVKVNDALPDFCVKERVCEVCWTEKSA